MIEQTFTIVNTLGLHARAAAKLVQLCGRFASQIQIRNSQRDANAKSIMGVMLLAAAHGTQVTVRVEGEDESDAMQAVQDLIESGFGEDVIPKEGATS